ncbi:MAG: zinc ABC transporter substrate-binding protein [Planctomycetaceae bacterium]|jgi:zinc transport system substrate-binding protein|nr:zinc ABC transporter substrate-binding protein [Planctomycetaceae bacterium]
MNLLFHKTLYTLLLVTVILTGCSSAKNDDVLPTNTVKLSVVVSVAPYAGLVERLGGDFVEAAVLVPVGKEPENYQPTPDSLTKISRAAVYFRCGFEFEESFLPKLKTVAPSIKIVDLRNGITLRQLELHSHDDKHSDHSDTKSMDVHTWLSTQNLKLQAALILDTLATIDPKNESYYAANYEKLTDDLVSLRSEVEKKLKPFANETIYVFHPAYGYFCDEFGLQQRAIEFEGRTPKPREQADWVRALRAEAKPVIFVQPEFNQSAAESLVRQIDGKIVIHSPLPHDPLNAISSLTELIIKNL